MNKMTKREKLYILLAVLVCFLVYILSTMLTYYILSILSKHECVTIHFYFRQFSPFLILILVSILFISFLIKSKISEEDFEIEIEMSEA